MKVQLAKSSLTGVTQFVVSTLLILVTIPMFIRNLGTEAYGLFSLVAVIGSVNTFANLGLNSSLVRFLAEQGKTTESDLDIVVTLLILLTILLPVAACAMIFEKVILINILNVPYRLFYDAEWLFVSMLISNIIILLGQTFTAILDSQQKVYLTNLFQMMYNIIYWGLIFLVLFLGYSLRSIAIVISISTALWFCIVVVSSLRSWGKLSLQGLGSNGVRVAKKQLKYGIKIYAGGVVGFFYEPLTKILVSRFLGVAEVGLFDIGLRVRNQIYGLGAKLLYPLYPIISQLEDSGKIRTLVHDIEQKTVFVIMPIIAIIVVITNPLVTLFFISNVEPISITIIGIVGSFLLGSITVTPNYLFLLAKGHASKTVILQSINVVVNAIVFTALFRWLGYYAVVAGNAIAILASCGLSLYYQKVYLHSCIFDSLRQPIVVTFVFSIALVIALFFNDMSDSGAWKILAGPFVVTFVSTLLYKYFSLFQPEDIFRYFGKGTFFSRLFLHVLCAKQVQ